MPEHLMVGSKTRSQTTPPEWLGVGRAIGQLTNGWAGRDDIVAYVGEGAGNGSAACYSPDLAEVEVDVKVAFGPFTTPAQIGDLTDPLTHYEFPSAIGAIMHEAFHAKFSRWSFADAAEALTQDEFDAMMLLEESRIEALGVRTNPDAKQFLRSSAIEIAMHDADKGFAAESSTKNAAMLVGLVHARIDAGVLTDDEAAPVTTIVDAFLGDEVVEKLRDIARRAQEHSAITDVETMYDLAREWVRIVNEVAESKGEETGSGSGGEGDGGSPGMSALADAIAEAMSEMAETVAISTNDALAEQEVKESWKQSVAESEKHAKESKANSDMAKEVFGKSTGPGASGSYSVLKEKRKPVPQERVAAVTIAQMLEKAKYRERDAAEIASVVPPGRLRTRAIVQGAALRERGVMADTQPWRRTVRKHTDDPSLSVGVLVDISGSMHAAMEPMATTAWVMSEATRRVQGRCAMVYFGAGVFPTLSPGQSLDDVYVYSAPDHTEKFDKAFRAIDGALNLLNGDGARLLVVVSDGCYTGPETSKAAKWIAECDARGVAVLWLPFSNTVSYVNGIVGKSVSVVPGVLNPSEAAGEIGRAAARALTTVGARNG